MPELQHDPEINVVTVDQDATSSPAQETVVQKDIDNAFHTLQQPKKEIAVPKRLDNFGVWFLSLFLPHVFI
jgi:hypothetical protein